jgi:hypothetical protein
MPEVTAPFGSPPPVSSKWTIDIFRLSVMVLRNVRKRNFVRKVVRQTGNDITVRFLDPSFL